MKIRCAHCGKNADKPAGAVNRARKAGMRVFCGRRCSGLARRNGKTKAQRVAEKKAYDARYRLTLAAEIKARKAEYHKRTYDPVKARSERKKRAKAHAEYCRRPEYRRWKREYDRQLRAKEYGPAAEAYLTLLELNREIKTRSSNYEIGIQNETLNKKQSRARASRHETERGRHRASEGKQLT